jgi:predicted GTPase
MARYKGVLPEAVQGAHALDTIKDGDSILISEGCTHHRQCDDIGTVKLPGWIAAHTNAAPTYTFTSGGEFPEDLIPYKLIIHCGGCMLNTREMNYRQRIAQESGVPMTNFGVAISHMQGILKRCIEML